MIEDLVPQHINECRGAVYKKPQKRKWADVTGGMPNRLLLQDAFFDLTYCYL